MTHSFFLNLSLITLKRLFLMVSPKIGIGSQLMQLYVVITYVQRHFIGTYMYYIVYSSTCLGPRQCTFIYLYVNKAFVITFTLHSVCSTQSYSKRNNLWNRPGGTQGDSQDLFQQSFGSYLNPISTGGGQIMPNIQGCPNQILKLSSGTVEEGSIC